MKSNQLHKLVSGIAFGCVFGFMASVNTVNAQTTNSIQEVNIQPNDGFNTLRELIADNFNFTNPELTEGAMTSNVQFSLTENGTITGVHAKGDCKYVDKEIEKVLNDLQYKVDPNKLKYSVANNSYVMPVSVLITNR